MGSNFYFFTDTDLLVPQVQSDAFGPAGTSGNDDVFRTSSMHTATANPGAYAVCDGILCVQEIPNTSPALVNLILKPLARPPVNFVPLRYYIYRGVRKDSLFSGAQIASPSTNQLTKSIWNAQEKKNKAANTPNVAPPPSALGIDLTALADPSTYADNLPIDNLFFRTGVDSQFPVVSGGWSIGAFDKNRFGFQILLEGMALRHPLAMTRRLEDEIRVPALTSSTQADTFAHWHAKEQILGYLDPCAFFGALYGVGVRAKSSNGQPEVRGAAQNKLYKDVLALFQNRNRIYVDIRNEHNRSFDYYNNYGRDIQIGYNATNTPTPIDYYVGGWPILILDGQFAPNNSMVNVLKLALPAGDNASPLLYILQGYKNLGAAGFSKELTTSQRVIRPKISGLFIAELALALPNVADATNAQPIASYVNLKYFRGEHSSEAVTSPLPAIRDANYLDNIFSFLDMQTSLRGPAAIKSVVFDDELFVHANADLGVDFIGKCGIAIDSSNVTLFSFPSFALSDKESKATIPFSIVGEAMESTDTYLNLKVLEFKPRAIEKNQVILTSTSTGQDILWITKDAGRGGVRNFRSPNFDHLVCVVFGKAVYQDLVTLAKATFLSDYPVYLGVRNLGKHTDSVGLEYTSSEIVLRGFVKNGSAGRIEAYERAAASGGADTIEVYGI